MAINIKSGLYSPVSMEAIKTIASHHKKSYRLLLAYLILSRFAGDKDVGGYGANRVIGAGAESIKNALSIGWPRANELIKELLRLKVLDRSPTCLRVGASQARYILTMPGDVQIPHALISGRGAVDGIIRLLNQEYAASPDLITTAIVVLLHLYKYHDMLRFGGVSPDMIGQLWVIDSVTPEGKGFKVTASRATNNKNTVATLPLFMETMQTMGIDKDARKVWLPVFQDALKLLRSSGLTYEAVTLFDAKSVPHFPVRLNDLHAAQSGSEPSFIEDLAGAAYYTRGEFERFWIFMDTDPIKTAATFVGICRLRFRSADPATAKALERDRLNLDLHRSKLIALDIMDDLKKIKNETTYR